MATKKFLIIGDGEVRIKPTGQGKTIGIGQAYKEEAPDESKYLVCKLEDYWLVSEEDYKLLSKVKRDEKHTN